MTHTDPQGNNDGGITWINNTLLPWVNSNTVGGTAWSMDPYNTWAGKLLNTDESTLTSFGNATKNWIAAAPGNGGGESTGTPTFSVSSSVPSSVAPGASVSVTVNYACTAGSLSNGILGLRINNGGWANAGNDYSGVNISSGQTQSKTFTFTAPTAAGTYSSVCRGMERELWYELRVHFADQFDRCQWLVRPV